MLGQVLPPHEDPTAIFGAAGPLDEQVPDETRFLAFRPVPGGSFRLRCLTRSGIDVMTGLITFGRR